VLRGNAYDRDNVRSTAARRQRGFDMDSVQLAAMPHSLIFAGARSG